MMMTRAQELQRQATVKAKTKSTTSSFSPTMMFLPAWKWQRQVTNKSIEFESRVDEPSRGSGAELRQWSWAETEPSQESVEPRLSRAENEPSYDWTEPSRSSGAEPRQKALDWIDSNQIEEEPQKTLDRIHHQPLQEQIISRRPPPQMHGRLQWTSIAIGAAAPDSITAGRRAQDAAGRSWKRRRDDVTRCGSQKCLDEQRQERSKKKTNHTMEQEKIGWRKCNFRNDD
jgi:hypothetical protein